MARVKQRYVIANWKMNLPAGGVESFARAMVDWQFSDITRLIVAPPFPFLERVCRNVSEFGAPVTVAAQNCSDKDAGAVTGEVSATMVRQTGATAVIVGHSERRTLFLEDDELVAAKLQAACSAALIPILCVGEPLKVRDSGDVREFLEHQISSSFVGLASAGQPVLIAYEPVWAIGTGRNASVEEIAEAVGWIREAVGERGDFDLSGVLYGGSVSEENVAELNEVQNIDGFLVGGASLDPEKLDVIYRSTSSRAY